MNIAYAQVNPLCSCQSSIAVLIVGRRKLALLQSGMAFSVSSAFIFIIYIIFVPISPIFSYFRMMFVLLTFSLFYPFTLVFTTGTSSDLSRKVRVTVYRGDTHRAVNL